MTPPFCSGDTVVGGWKDVSCEEACGTQCCSGGGCDLLDTEVYPHACGLLPAPGEVGCVDCCTYAGGLQLMLAYC